jgi:hypothetical protein
MSRLNAFSPVEYEVLTHLAIERESISLAELARDLMPRVRHDMVVDAIETLRRRSLVERGELEATFTLQSIVLEYVTDRIVAAVSEEIRGAPPVVLLDHPLMKAQAKEYVRQAQERLIGAPIVQQLSNTDDRTAAGTQMLRYLTDGVVAPRRSRGTGQPT